MKDITINRLNVMFNSDHSMMNVIIGEIEKKANRISFNTLWLAWGFLFVSFLWLDLLGIIIYVLTIILGLDLILLYNSIYSEIIIPDKIKEIYNNGYWMRGSILIEDLTIDIDEFFLNSEELEKHIGKVINKKGGKLL